MQFKLLFHMRAAQSVAVFARNVKKVKKSQRILSVANAYQ